MTNPSWEAGERATYEYEQGYNDAVQAVVYALAAAGMLDAVTVVRGMNHEPAAVEEAV